MIKWDNLIKLIIIETINALKENDIIKDKNISVELKLKKEIYCRAKKIVDMYLSFLNKKG